MHDVLQIRERPTSTEASLPNGQNQQKKFLAVMQELRGTAPLPVSLAMAKVHPAELAISLLAVSCFIAVVIQCSCLSTCH